MTFCKNCMYWGETFEREGGKVFGECSNTLLTDKIIVDKQEDLFQDDKAIYTEQRFGCNYFINQSGNVVTEME